MATILRSLRYIRKFGGTSGRVLFNQPKNVINSIIRCNHDSLAVLERDRWSKPIAPSKKEFIENKIRNIEESIKIRNRVWKNEISSVMYKIQSSDDITSLQALLLLRCCGSAIVEHLPFERVKLVQELWDILNTHNIPIDVFHYNALIQVHLENDNEFSSTQLLLDMNKRNIKPNKVTYNRLIEYYCKRGLINDATKVLECMRDEGLPLTENIFNSLITGHSQAGDMENAIKILDIMKDNKIKVTADTYTALMCAYAKRNDIEKIQEIITTCETQNLYLINKNFFDIIYIMASNNSLEHINKIFLYVNQFVNGHETVNFLLSLININQVDLSLKLMEIVLEKINTPSLRAHIIQLFLLKVVNSNMEAEKIVEVCEYFKNMKLANNPLLIAVQCSFPKRNKDLSLKLLEACREMQYIIRPHFFWPILVDRGQKNDFQGILDILKLMVNDFHVIPCIDTIKDFVIPYTFGSLINVHNLLKKCQVSDEIINNAVVYSYLKSNKTRKAVQYMRIFPDIYGYNILGAVLRRALCNTDDVESFLYIIERLHEKSYNDIDNPSHVSTDEDFKNTTIITIDELLMDFLNELPLRHTILSKLILHMADRGYNISKETADAISYCLGDSAQDNVKCALAQISQIIQQTDDIKHATVLLNKIKEQQSKNLPVDILERRLISILCRNKTDEGEPLSRELYVFMISYFCKIQNLAFAERYMQELEKIYYRCDDAVLNLEYAKLLVKKLKPGAAHEYLLKNGSLTTTDETEILSEKLLLYANNVRYGINAKQFEQLVRVLITSKYRKPSSASFSMVVNAYIREKNLPKAVKFFCSVMNLEARLNNAKHQLTKALINAEEHVLLQELIDHCSEVEPKSKVLVDLFFDFLECNKIKQAMKVLEMQEFYAAPHKIRNQIEKYVEKLDSKSLEIFLEATKHIAKLRKLGVYENLVQIYARKNDWQSGLNLLTNMQEDNILPSMTVLTTLGALLDKNGRTVPFVYDKQKPPKKWEADSRVQEKVVEEETIEYNDLENMKECTEKVIL